MTNKLDGKKTYIIALLIGVTASLTFLGFIDTETSALITTFLLGGGVATLRDAISKI
jgi:hypothetical protein